MSEEGAVAHSYRMFAYGDFEYNLSNCVPSGKK